jgi:hypothetical protein
MTPAGFPHSDTPGSTLGCQLPRAYRRLLRPSSALDAKASTMCPSQLVTHTTNPTPPPNKQVSGTRAVMHTSPQEPQGTQGRPRHSHKKTRTPPPNQAKACTTNNHTHTHVCRHERCSRPLSRSQTTTPHPHHTHPHHRRVQTCQQEPGEDDPTTPTPSTGPRAQAEKPPRN